MNSSLDSRARQKSDSAESNPTVREVVDAMPAVIFYRAVRDAFFSGAKAIVGAVKVQG